MPEGRIWVPNSRSASADLATEGILKMGKGGGEKKERTLGVVVVVVGGGDGG